MSEQHPDTEPTSDEPIFWKDGKQFIRLYYFMPEKHLLAIIQNDEIKVSIPDYCNDPLEFLAANEDDVGYSFECGFISFSSHFGSSLMWSHYADSHKGVCLQFDFPIRQTGDIIEPNRNNWNLFMHYPPEEDCYPIESITNFAVLNPNEHVDCSQFFTITQMNGTMNILLVKVHYNSQRPGKSKVSMFGSFNEGGIKELGLEPSIYTKSSEWAYEKEWRIYVTLNGTLALHDEDFFVTGLTQYITKIIVGAKFPKRHGLLEHYVTQSSKKNPNPESRINLKLCSFEQAEYHPEKYEIIVHNS